MSDERPDALLKSALEKIVYFEARAEQLLSELNSTREEMEHLKRELAEAHQRELELRREVAELEVRVGRAQAEREESVRLTQALRGERNQLMEKLLDASRLRASTQERDAEDDDLGFDLASFISQLRSEALLRGDAPRAASAVLVPTRGPAVALTGEFAKVSAPEAPAPMPTALLEPLLEGLSPVAREAQRFRQEGRLGVSAAQLAELSSSHGGIGTPSDETLFGFSVRELSAPDAAARVRAAERLKALAQPSAAPALATALHAETDATAQVALLQAFAALCREEGAQVVSPLLASPVPEVRIAALKALLTLAPRDAAPHLAQAMKDPDRSVRRRASLLALGLEGETARRLGEEAIHDTDPEVRSLAALALGAGSGENARTLLLGALGDREPRVRKAASQSLSRILGQDVSAVVDLDETHRRREIRRLATLPVRPVRARLDAPRAVAAPAPVQVPVAVVAPVTGGAVRGAAPGHAGSAMTAAHAGSDMAAPVHAVARTMVAAHGGTGASTSTGAQAGGVARAGQDASAYAVVGAVARSAAGSQPGAVVPQGAPRGSSLSSLMGASGAPPARPVATVPQSPGARPGVPVPPAQAQPRPPPAAQQSRLSPVQAALVAMGAPPPQPQAPAVRPAEPARPVPARSPVEALCGQMLAEVRTAVRGRSLAELTAALSAPAELAQEALTLLSARGAVVRRGHKYFAA
ncbi:HEAT repeat domain-containing protein [Myxococcus sp. K15C18031901]|uniref:HEAT repeat domain-containing protein n=1 Tax=Myxococcus dinghuensis TaxID=2906761 RepID=UPI0020A79D79|nr:HEAT repeat domain-containing protein [Myxococcus dinghuensis]MCP3101001.1 HEAT repeat domain-containing protein [Myxococcus dinghuensis]